MILQKQRLEDTISERHPLFIILPNGRMFIIKDGTYLMKVVEKNSPMDTLYLDPSPFLELGPPEVHTSLNIFSDVIWYIEKGGIKKYKQWKEKKRRKKLKEGKRNGST